MTAMNRERPASYTRTGKFLHWLIALLIIGMLALGWCFGFFQGQAKFTAYQLHKSIGITILLLAGFRLAWRLTHRQPALPAAMPVWEKGAAHLGHLMLYTAMIVMPLSGWIMVSASPMNIPTLLYGLLPWPAFPGVSAAADKAQISHASHFIHGYLALALATLIVAHAAAALKHHFMSKDDILMRMAPRFSAHFLERLRGRR